MIAQDSEREDGEREAVTAEVRFPERQLRQDLVLVLWASDIAREVASENGRELRESTWSRAGADEKPTDLGARRCSRTEGSIHARARRD